MTVLAQHLYGPDPTDFELRSLRRAVDGLRTRGLVTTGPSATTDSEPGTWMFTCTRHSPTRSEQRTRERVEVLRVRREVRRPRPERRRGEPLAALPTHGHGPEGAACAVGDVVPHTEASSPMGADPSVCHPRSRARTGRTTPRSLPSSDTSNSGWRARRGSGLDRTPGPAGRTTRAVDPVPRGRHSRCARAGRRRSGADLRCRPVCPFVLFWDGFGPRALLY